MTNQIAQKFLPSPIITIYESYPFSPRIDQSHISRRTHPSILLVKHFHSAILPSIFIADLTGPVLAAVIDEKALEIGESLGQDAVHTASQGRFRVINRYYY